MDDSSTTKRVTACIESSKVLNSTITTHSDVVIDTVIKKSDMHFSLVQELRGFAALWVVLFHASAGGHLLALENYLPAAINSLVFKAGHYGVAVFFALSGFVIAHSLRDASGSFKYFVRFIVRRSIRLDPPYWASIIFVMILDYLASKLMLESFSGITTENIIAHIFYVQVILNYPEINTVYWTLTYEIQFYLFFAFIIFATSSLTQKNTSFTWMTVAWTFLDILAFASTLRLLSIFPKGFFVDLWPSFYIGVLAYRSQDSKYARLSFVILLSLMLLLPSDNDFLRLSAITALFLAWSLYTRRIFHGMGWKKLQAIGLISYSLYLTHNPVTGAVGFAVERVAGSGLVGASIALVSIVSASMVCAFLFWWAIERPAHRLSQAILWSGRPRRSSF